MTKGRHIVWTAAELEWISSRRELPRRELHAAFVEEFGRDDVSLKALCGLCKRKGWLTGRDGRFAAGHTPANTGQRMPYNEKSAAHRFKKGRAPHNTQPFGHERIRDGYIEVKVAQRNPYTGKPFRYLPKHRVRWEAENGPVPEGHALKSLDGDRLNTDPANWVAVPRALLPRLAGCKGGRRYDQAPAELKPTIMAVTRLEHAAREARRRDE